jgi:hypothetical protein
MFNTQWFCPLIAAIWITKPVPMLVRALNTSQLNTAVFQLGLIQASNVKSVNDGEFATHGMLT